jgi:signal transduction histidine kinase
MKIRNKLTNKFAAIVASILLLFSISIYYFSSLYREQEFDNRLVEKGLTTARLLIKVDEVDIKLLRIIDKNNLTALQNEKVTVYNSRRNKIYTSDDDPEIPIPPAMFSEIQSKGNLYFNHDGKEAVGILYKEKQESYIVIVSAYDKFGINKLKNLRIVLIAGFLVSVGAIFLGGWLFSGQALKPINHIINEVKKITAPNLSLRVNTGNGQDEIALLAITFNQMLDRIEFAFSTQKSFVSNASHELRTPLSTMRAQLEFAAQNPRDEEEYKNIIASVLVDLNNMISLSNGLLDLAQIESEPDFSSFSSLRIDELIFQCISEISKKYPSQKISFKVEDLSDDDKNLQIAGIESLLKTAIFNIIDNACKYSGNSPIITNIGFIENKIMITVIDSGYGIDSRDLKHIFDPFYRGTNVMNISGHGIGLPLSEKIIGLHNGKIEIFSKVNEGTTVMIQIPKLT